MVRARDSLRPLPAEFRRASWHGAVRRRSRRLRSITKTIIILRQRFHAFWLRQPGHPGGKDEEIATITGVCGVAREYAREGRRLTCSACARSDFMRQASG